MRFDEIKLYAPNQETMLIFAKGFNYIKRCSGNIGCPFCGSGNINRIITTSHCEVVCHNCKARIVRGLFCGKYDCLEDAENDFGKEADEAWNTRTPKERGGEK